jgi:diguanylate cyclase (GGDEF)-like protein
VAEAIDWVVVAEANPNRADRIRQVFQAGAFAVETVRNGDEIGPTLDRTPPPSLLVLNLTLPVLDGLSVLRRLAAANNRVPVIALTNVPSIRDAAVNVGYPELTVLGSDASPMELEIAATRALKRDSFHARESKERTTAPQAGTEQPWIQRYLNHLAQEFAATFDVASVVVGVSVGTQTWCAIGVRPLTRPLTASTHFLDWPFVRDAVLSREMLVVPNVADHPVFSTTVLPPAGILQGVAIMPMMSRTGTAVGAVCLLHVEALTMDASALQIFETRVRAATAEIERTLATESYASQLTAVRRQMDGQRADADARIAALSEVALRDPLTGMLNRRGGEEALAREVARVNRTRVGSSLLLLDIDHFKQINDTYGHATGDHVLAQTARVIQQLQRGSDFGIRWGGEEFLVVLPDIDVEGARSFGERVRNAIENLAVAEIRPITISGGTAEIRPSENVTEAIVRADRCLYQAKAEGRNLIR